MQIFKMGAIFSFMMFLAATILPLSTYAADMSIDRQCGASYCDFILTGVITKQTPELLRKATVDMQGSVVVLESPGGSLTAGLELGRVIRKNGLRTRVGSWDNSNQYSNTCLSACAYAFLGGINREVEKGAKLGFHRFSVANEKDKLVNANSALKVAQDLSSSLVNYVLEMEIDARIFTVASNAPPDQMYVPDDKTLLEYEIITPAGFSQFALRAAQNGVVADSDRQHASNKYQNLTTLTAYCQQGVQKLLFQTNVMPLFDWGPAQLNITYYVGEEPYYETIETSSVSLQKNETQVYVIAEISKQLSGHLEQADKIESSFDYPNAAGGGYEFSLELDDNDHQSLNAAFRLCI